uniref:Uncharacterized protein n=1 Tax=viral metagenome TaxID=1070528 RepID=A0A6M3KLA9_9ZZZZ
MRTLSATLLAAQISTNPKPLIKITFSKVGESDIVVEQDKILQVPDQDETTDSQTVDVIFDNSAGYFTSLDLKGWAVVFQWGLTTTSGAEYSALPAMKVISQDFYSARGVLQCRMSFVGIPNLLADDKASKDYNHHWSDTKTVKALITEVASGVAVTTELTEQQTTSDGYIELRAYDVGTTDLVGAVKTQAAKAATSVVLKSLGTGTINRLTKLTIEGHGTDYIVTADATITSNEATVSITPALTDVAEVDDAIQLAWRWGSGQTGTLHGAGQRVTIDNRTITSISFRLKKTGSPTGTNVTFKIRATDDDETLASKTFAIASIGTSPAWCEAVLAAPVTVNEEVWIYCEYTDGDASNYVSVSYNSAAVKSGEDLIVVDSVAGVVPYGDLDCAYKYQYNATGIDCYTHCVAYTVTYDSEDSLIDVFAPADGFNIREGESRLNIINRLLAFTGCVKRVENDGEIHVFVPTTTGTSYNSEYSLVAGEHIFFSKAIRNALVIPNKITVHSYPDDDDQYTGSATSAASYALLTKDDFKRAKLISNAQATSIATAMIAQAEINAQTGGASAIMNLGSEVYDYVKVTDSRESDSRVGNIGHIKRSYIPRSRKWQMDFSFGKVMLKPLVGTKPSQLTSRLTESQYQDEMVLKWGMLSPYLTEYNDALSRLDNNQKAIVDTLDEIISKLGYFEGQTPTSDQIDEGLVGYLKNLAEDTSPQLGGNLDCNTKQITGAGVISNGASAIYFIAGSVNHVWGADGSLDMGTEKITSVVDPTADQDVATKKYVDDNAGGGVKAIWAVPTNGTGTNSSIVTYPAYYCQNGQNCLMTFKVPAAFTTISSVYIWVVPTVTQAAANWDIFSKYGSVGEVYDEHGGTLNVPTYNVTNAVLFRIDISSVLTSLAAGDIVGIEFLVSSANHDAKVLGLLFEYT